MNRSSRITIKDVARKAGVSTQTVSRVINNRPDVSTETRALVKTVIANLGFAPNVLARSLIQGRSNTIGVVGFGLEYYGPSNTLVGIEKKVYELGYSLQLSLLDRFDPEKMDNILAGLLARQVDGIIWAVPGQTGIHEWVSEKLSLVNIPLVQINKCEDAAGEVVATDNYFGAWQATRHLMEQGYQHIGIITGPMEWWEASERYRGWEETINPADCDDLAGLVFEGDWTAASGDVGLHTLLTQSPAIEAVFVSNDQMALGAFQAARRLGLDIPGRLGVVGFDDLPEAAYYYPPLTTIRQNPLELGALAVERMHSLIQASQTHEELVPEVTWIKPRLIVRKSSIRSSNGSSH
jgi:LacI family transcriptional regulator